jgi:hypothetical protein
MEKLQLHIKEIAKLYPLEAFPWRVPKHCPVAFPSNLQNDFEKNIYLKANLGESLRNSNELALHYWVVQDWGGIGSFKKNERNDERIRTFISELEHGRLSIDSFACISSLSKIASFIDPALYSIYDSRAIYSLNWLIYSCSGKESLFPQPAGRSAQLSKFDMQTIFRLAKSDYGYRKHEVAYHDYCKMMKDFAENVYGSDALPYKLEMLLFMIAPTLIVEDIERRTSVSIAES